MGTEAPKTPHRTLPEVFRSVRASVYLLDSGALLVTVPHRLSPKGDFTRRLDEPKPPTDTGDSEPPQSLP